MEVILYPEDIDEYLDKENDIDPDQGTPYDLGDINVQLDFVLRKGDIVCLIYKHKDGTLDSIKFEVTGIEITISGPGKIMEVVFLKRKAKPPVTRLSEMELYYE